MPISQIGISQETTFVFIYLSARVVKKQASETTNVFLQEARAAATPIKFGLAIPASTIYSRDHFAN
ncbi:MULTISPECIES: hypothetical protein [unclassified Bartonella]|uniref:hypothetical protein n=1 Tax=unclassified Bartonella TaxID=2645622 RepID=UPI0035CF49B2